MYDYDRFYGTYENYRNMREIQDTRELNSYYKENKIDHQDKKTKTALHLAVQLENEEIIDLLLNQKRIDINVKDDQFKTPYESTQNPKIKAMFEKVMNKV